MQTHWCDHIIRTPDVLRDKPQIKDTRILVGLILGYLAAGNTVFESIGESPDLKEKHIYACLDYARELTEYEVAA